MSRSFYNSHILDKVLDPEQHSSRRRDRSIRSADNERSKRRSPSTDSNQPRKRSKRLRLQSDDFEGVESPGTNEVPAEDVAYLDFGEELPEQSSRERQQNEVLMVLQSIEKHLSTLASAASTERAVKPKPSTKDVAAQVSPDGHRSNNASSSRRDNETVKREPEKNFYELITSKPSPLVTCPPPPKVNAETICLVCFGAGHWAGCCPTKERIARGKLCGLYKHLCCHCHTPRSLHKM